MTFASGSDTIDNVYALDVPIPSHFLNLRFIFLSVRTVMTSLSSVLKIKSRILLKLTR